MIQELCDGDATITNSAGDTVYCQISDTLKIAFLMVKLNEAIRHIRRLEENLLSPEEISKIL